MQRETTGMPYLLKDKQCIQQITRPRMGKKRKPACKINLYSAVKSLKDTEALGIQRAIDA